MAKQSPRSDEMNETIPGDGERKVTTADRIRDEFRVRRDDAVVIPAPQEPINAPATVPEPSHRTAMYEGMRRRSVIRGGVSLPAIFTGAFVAMGAMVLVMAVTAGLLAATGVIKSDGTVQNEAFVRATVLTGVGLAWRVALVIGAPLAVLYGYAIWRIGLGRAVRRVWWRLPELLDAVSTKAAA